MIIAVFAALSFTLLFCLPNGLYEKQTRQKQAEAGTQVLAAETQKENRGFPVRLKIPSINVDAAIEYVGLTSKGEMEVPSSGVNAGWFKLGARPGEMGSAVIAGHLDQENGEAGVFADLYKLKEKDKLYIEDDKGTSSVFVVREIRSYDSEYADEVFTRGDGAYLNLITCGGMWDEVKKSYSERLVVFADATN